MIGQLISHYKILERLGGGGMGVVYTAEDTKLKRTVALKFLPPEFTRDPEAKERFIHEAQAASALDHNNICNVHEIGETDDGQLFIAMAYYEGETLKMRISEGGMRIDEAVDIAIQVAQGLQKAHEKGIVHRDVKPANVMIASDGVVKILDFGLAKLAGLSKLTRVGSTVGTAAYMSPEQARGEDVDYRADIWSLGVVLYEMVVGRLPFKSEYQEAVVYSILNEEPPALTSLRSDVPMELERIVKKAIAKSRDERYQHTDELLVDLYTLQRECVKGGTVSKRKREYGASLMLRKPTLWTSIILGTTIFLAIGYYMFTSWRGRPEPEPGWENSVAVLPFKNYSSDPEQEYFCDGMTEQITTNLSQLTMLKVTGRSSAMTFKGSSKTIPEIGRILNVRYVLEGSVRKSGNRFRVTTQLISVADGFHLWARDYDHNVEDIFEVQDDISQQIASALIEKLRPSEVRETKTRRSSNPEAYLFYLKASQFSDRYAKNERTEDFKNAEAMFNKAIELDPKYGQAYGGLAFLYAIYVDSLARGAEESKRYTDLADDFSQKALTLDPESPDVLTNRADVLYFVKQQSVDAYRFVRDALKRNQNHIRANLLSGFILRNQGLVKHSFAYFERVAELEPLEPWSYVGRARSHWLLGKIDTAFVEYERGLQVEPNDVDGLHMQIHDLLVMKRWERAEALIQRTKTREAAVPRNWHESWRLVGQGRVQEALQEIETTQDDGYSRFVLDMLMGSFERAVEYLEKRWDQERNDDTRSQYLNLSRHPFYDPLRRDPRFEKIVAQERLKYPRVLRLYEQEERQEDR
jgi:serine/threonine protein kinase/tetratricopeptide (TPR) repeat protein